MNTIYIKRFLPFLTITLLLLSVMFGCASPKVTTRPTTTEQPSKVEQTISISGDYILSQAKKADTEQAIALLQQASEQYLVEQNYAKSLWLAQQLLTLVTEKEQRHQIQLIKAENLYLLDEIELSYQSLQQATSIIEDESQLGQKYFQLLAKVQYQRGLPLIAADATLRAFHFNPSPSAEEINHVWQRLNALSQWQVEQLVALAPPQIAGWQQLLNFAHRFGHQAASFNRYLTQWRRNFPEHPAKLIAKQLTAVKTNEQPPTNIAVILPLSGKHKNAGESAQQGLLAGYNPSSELHLKFIDSHQLDFSTLAQTLADNNIDHVIGPLLKPNVDAYIQQEALTLPTLLLNLPIQAQIKASQMVFSMDVKDEAIQAATTLSRQQYQHPIVLSQRDNVSQRIALTFVNQWQKITGSAPEIIFFDDRSKMQEQLEISLGIKQSQDRIDEIDQRIRQKLETEARNRRDIDMIYLVSTPNETRLLKPYIDVNISPFADAIPIFASSRSHSDNADSSDSRDLTGLQFTEMPWLLKSKQQNQALKQLVDSIWPNTNDNLKRIFAMGYDSLALINKFSALKQVPYIRHYGQTGIIKLTQQGILTRSLLWGSYQKDKVEEIAMDSQQ